MAEKKFIAFDIGAESGRCMVGLLNNKIISLHEVHRFRTPSIKYDYGFHWDILAIYEEIIEGLKKAKKEFGNYFDGIGIDTWGVDYVLLDSENRLLGYPYHYRDDRTDNMMEEAFLLLPKEKIYKSTGIQFVQINTIYQLLSERKRKASLLDVADKILFIPDFLNFLLTGEKVSEYSIASTSGLVNPVTRNWSWEVIEALGLRKGIFPKLIEPGLVLGKISASTANLTQLDPNISVIATTCHDTASAVVGVPALSDSWAYLSSGTWSLMGVELNQPVLSDDALNNNFTNEGGFNNTIRFLKNILGLWPIQECKRYWDEKEEKKFTYAELTEMADNYGSAGAWVDLSDSRFLKSGDMPEKIIAFLKETAQKHDNNYGFVIRVIIESLAYSYRDTLKKIESVTAKKIERLHVVGGGIQNELLTQLTADATGCEVIAGPVEGAVLGNIGVQAISKGIVKNINEWREIVGNSSKLKTYLPNNKDYFDKNIERYNKVLR
ncbi:rhamnulokinase [Melioribacter sp. OK-6-Me]|uniref:rhamnulokinase n=1 Tax=unclassified Melioribacter TaxID=2627329 RepID=UPI003EDA08EF